MSTPSSEVLAFGPFRLSRRERLLTRDGVAVDIGGRALDLLTALVEQRGRVLSKRELLERVWPDVVVEDGSLRFHMAALRKVLGDGEDGARYISTQVGVGYAFVASVEVIVVDEPAPAPQPAESSAQSLPARVRLIGRERDLTLLTEQIASSTLFTIVGAGGVGKTTMAVELAYRLAGRFEQVNFVDLASVQDPTLLASTLATALGIPVQAEDAIRVILGHIGWRKLLLVLDNCEHLISAAASLVEKIGDAAPGVCVLATSRESLRVRGERVHWLGALEYPVEPAEMSLEQLLAYPAIELFAERARAADSTLQIDLAAARVMADMCRRVDGMALPIELTAVRVGTHGFEATARMLREHYALSWAGRRTAMPRQQTLQATLDWSYELLSDIERLTLDRLSVFVGSFTPDAALAVAGGSPKATDFQRSGSPLVASWALAALDELTAKSLVVAERGARRGGYRLLEMTRAYAREKLHARGPAEVQATARSHATYFAHTLESNAPQSELAASLGNIRGALSWCFGPDGDPALTLHLAARCVPVLLKLALLDECRGWCERALALMEDEHRGTAIELELQGALGTCSMLTRGHGDSAEAALRRGLALSSDLGDARNELLMLGRLHLFHERIGDFATALGWAEDSRRVADKIGSFEARAVAHALLGISHHLAGDQLRARGELEVSLDPSLPPDLYRSRSGIALARCLWLLGYADQARTVAERTIHYAGAFGNPTMQSLVRLWNLSVCLWSGDVDKAREDLSVFASLAEANAFELYIVAANGFRGQLAILQGRTEEGVRQLEAALARLRTAHYAMLTSTFVPVLATGLIDTGRDDEARRLLDATIDDCRRSGELFALPELLRVKARTASPNTERWLLDALDCARGQGARAWELRAANDLARVWLELGQAEDARRLLQPLRNGFDEGLDTLDIREADQVLTQIARSAS
ncbi:winged helix-turn-helix domain-containing protein [Pendulispora rubella]|uniref:Winged helix-turn-helix domain-containing protein n=1 Tax=Pendulispora rubella TaxID=2741070 RepID=A0ABZ2L724_9BACT